MSNYNPLYPVRGMALDEKKSFRDTLIAIDTAMPWAAQDAGRCADVPEERTCGICDLVYRKYPNGIYGKDEQGHTTQTTSFLGWVCRAAKAWSEYSDCKTYPVPAPKGSIHTPSSAYNMAFDMWAGEYGLLRKSLLNHLIVSVSEAIAKDEEEDRTGVLTPLKQTTCDGGGFVLYHATTEQLITVNEQLVTASLTFTELDSLGAVWQTYEEARDAMEETPFVGVSIGKIEERIATHLSVYKPKEAL